MNLEQAATYWKLKLTQQRPINRVRVRRLLELAGAERRGSNIMSGIRRTLENNGLITEPDFQSVWPDSLVTINLSDPLVDFVQADGCDTANRSEAEPPVDGNDPHIIDPAFETEDVVEANTPPRGETLDSPDTAIGLVENKGNKTLDPIARVSSISSSKGGVSTVLLTDSIELATTKMSLDGYSQLAIMQNDREVRGMISWESIAKRSMLTPSPTSVADCRIDAQVVDADSSLYDALPVIAAYGYVLVRSQEKKITGIVSASDLAVEFGQLSYAFISLRAIEVLIRGKLHPVLMQEDLQTLEEHSFARTEADPARLTFGENVRLLQREEIWLRIKVRADKAEVTKRLLAILDVRNHVMHFDPEPLSPEKRQKLLQMETFLKQAFA